MWGKQMKKIMMLALVATSLTSAPAIAAGTHTSSDVTYANGVFDWAIHNGYTQSTMDAYFGFTQSGGTTGYSNIPGYGSGTIDHTQLGSRYRQSTSAPDDTEEASNTAGGTFTLKGHVNADCSFYNGSSPNHSIDLGTIGVRTGDADNVTIAFNQAAAASAHIDTATAGCNTSNKVTISEENNGKGLVNNSPGNYDTLQFTAKIPYSLTASWTGAGTATTTGSAQTLLVPASGSGTNSKSGGAWRSAFNMDIAIPAQPLGLVAGNYDDKITVTLKVD